MFNSYTVIILLCFFYACKSEFLAHFGINEIPYGHGVIFENIGYHTLYKVKVIKIHEIKIKNNTLLSKKNHMAGFWKLVDW